MADTKRIDALLVPGMMNLNVGEALEKAKSLCVEMRESSAYCTRLLDRLAFLREELPKQIRTIEHAQVLAQLANAIGLVVRFLKKYSEKKLLQRIASTRLITEDVTRLHEKIDDVFMAAGLANASQMTEWMDKNPSDLANLRDNLEELVRSRASLVTALTGSALEEALAELKFEVVLSGNSSFKEPLAKLLDAVAGQVPGATIPDILVWFLRRDDVVLGDAFDEGSFGAVRKAKKGVQETEVCVKLLFMGDADTQSSFLREATIWHGLSHSNVVKMLGGCHVGKPLFFVSEYTEHGNFSDFFYGDANKGKLWRLFLEAAQGLAYLHDKRIVHSDIKANNILVGNDGNAKLCDFGFSDIRTQSIGKSIKPQPSPARWKAPEYLLEQGVAANPSFKSDVYSLGMSIIEAKIGGVPWGVKSDDEIIDELAESKGYPRPDGVFSDTEWDLIRSMIEFDPKKRMPLSQAIEILAEFAKAEHAKEKHISGVLKDLEIGEQKKVPEPADTLRFVQCWSCHENTSAAIKFCGECGILLSDSENLPKLEDLHV